VLPTLQREGELVICSARITVLTREEELEVLLRSMLEIL
jgi:hypothetical protein